MTSQKKLSLKNCLKCKEYLSSYNWNKYDKKVKHYICKICRKKQDKKRYRKNSDYSKKQMARYRSRQSAIIHSYGDACIFCGEDNYYKLIIDCKNNDVKQTSNKIYNWLYNNPIQKDGYQILCYNCKCSKNITYKDKYALRDKKRVIEAYGNQCVECGEDKIERLTIENKKSNTGIHLYRWIIKNDFPDNLGLKIMCYNCSNFCKKELIAETKAQILAGAKAKNASVLEGSTSELDSLSLAPKLL